MIARLATEDPNLASYWYGPYNTINNNRQAQKNTLLGHCNLILETETSKNRCWGLGFVELHNT